MSATPMRLRHRMVHGHRLAFRMAGKGPALVLIHGIGASSETWSDVMPALAKHYRVIAPDMLGHGGSDKPRYDYSVPTFANGVRDLLTVLGIERATLVGHSLGGAAAMQFAYQYPERTERLVLVSTGGVGKEVTRWLRFASLPGAAAVLNMSRLPGFQTSVAMTAKVMAAAGHPLAVDGPDLNRALASFPDVRSRIAFVRTLRAVVDWRGQVGTMLDRCYLSSGMPTMLMWGDNDRVVPTSHAGFAQVAMPGSRLEFFSNTGHFPQHTQPERFVSVLHEFISSTQPAGFSPEQWRQLLRLRRTVNRLVTNSSRDAAKAEAENTIDSTAQTPDVPDNSGGEADPVLSVVG